MEARSMSSFRIFRRRETSITLFLVSTQPKVFATMGYLTVMSASTADFATAGWGNPDGSTKIATAPIATNSVAPGSGSDAVGSRSLDNIAVRANEDGVGGEV